MYYIKKRFEVAGCHRLELDYESPCGRMHGHNWTITVHCRARTLDQNGMVLDFKKVKDVIHGALDHRNLNDSLPFNPTAENIARWIAGQVPGCFRVEVQESEGNVAIWEEDAL